MKVITLYESTDGSKWKTEAEAIQRDSLDAEVRAIEAQLPERPKSGQRIAVSIAVVNDCKRAVIELCRREFPNEPVFKHPPEKIHQMSFAGRFLDDVTGPLDRVWRWFCCEKDGWLYEQPYFALNPDKFEEAKP